MISNADTFEDLFSFVVSFFSFSIFSSRLMGAEKFRIEPNVEEIKGNFYFVKMLDC